jgi:hypothetical protein
MSTEGADDRDEGFLSRWSRRKRDIMVAPPAPAPVQAEPVPEAGADDRPKDPETGEIIDQDLVGSLPDIATLQPGADLSAFMRKGVPEALRRQALRALWSADPAIRDFVSPALDYAYDYNAPGGAPGYGPLTESDIAQAKEFLASVFSDPKSAYSRSADVIPPEHGDVLPQHDPPQPDILPSAVRRTDVATHNHPETDAGTRPANGASQLENTPDSPQSAMPPIVRRNINDLAVDPLSTENQALHTMKRRRGGGATPV